VNALVNGNGQILPPAPSFHNPETNLDCDSNISQEVDVQSLVETDSTVTNLRMREKCVSV